MTEPGPIVGDPAKVTRAESSGPGSQPPAEMPSGAPDGWHTPAGQLVAAWEQTQFDEVLADVFGFHAVQLGLPRWPTLRANRMPHHLVVSLAGEVLPDRSPAMQTDPVRIPAGLTVEHFQSLPFADGSLDLIVAPHALERDADPRQTLREIERVLRPEGRLVLTGFNPVSLWGAQQLMDRTPAGRVRLPWISPPRLKDWYALLGLELQQTRHGVYRPRLSDARWLDRTRFLERAGDRWWPICGAVYLTIAVKRVQAMRMVGQDFRRSRLRAQTAAVGARRQADQGLQNSRGDSASLSESRRTRMHRCD